MPLILGANTLSAGGYEVDNSLRFNSGSSDYLSRSLGASETSIQRGTFSFWVKRSSLTSASSEMIYSNEVADDNNRGFIQFEDNDSFRMVDTAGGVNQLQLKTNRLFRDVSAWYHIVVAIDTTQSTASDRLKIYINGVQETSFSTETYPDQNDNLKLLEGGQTDKNLIGLNYGGSAYFGGYLAEFVYIDGTQNAVTDFGEFDEDSGIWKPINVSGLTFGNNGFFLEFKDSSALGDDTSGNGNDFTVNNLTSIDQTTDTPTNNFATLNPLNVPVSNQPTFSNGNLISTSSTAVNGSFGGSSSMGVSTGKWYIEAKAGAIVSSNVMNIGVTYDPAETARTNNDAKTSYEYVYMGSNGYKGNNNTDTPYGDSYTTGDIIGIALDLDNSKIYFSKNGVFQNSGDPTSGATGTGAAFTVTSGQTYSFYQQDETGASANTSQFEFNFGNPPFTISSGNRC
jgi:hypothetical protein